jgi:uncharacterized membrane protein
MTEISPERILSWDVIVAVVYAALVVPLQWIGLTSPIPLVFLAPVLLFLPGYALTTVLFPGQPTTAGSGHRAGRRSAVQSPGFGVGSTTDDSVSRLDLVERTALSVGVSVGLLPLFALGFDLVLGTVVGPAIATAAIGSAVTMLGGGVRRSQLPEGDRFAIPIERWFEGAESAVADEPPSVAAVNVALAASVVLALLAVGVAFAAPNQGATFTEFAVGSERGGEFVTDDYPDDLAVGETAEPAILIENREREPIEYHVIARFERVEDGTVTAAEEAGRFTVTVEHGETVVESQRITRSMTGDDIRLRFLLYRDEPLTDLGNEPAYRSVHVWLSVE